MKKRNKEKPLLEQILYLILGIMFMVYGIVMILLAQIYNGVIILGFGICSIFVFFLEFD